LGGPPPVTHLTCGVVEMANHSCLTKDICEGPWGEKCRMCMGKGSEALGISGITMGVAQAESMSDHRGCNPLGKVGQLEVAVLTFFSTQCRASRME